LTGPTDDDIQRFRPLFPHTSQGKLYINHAGTSPLSTRVVDAFTRYLRERSEGRIETYPQDLPMVGECRTMIARLINTTPERIAVTVNTSAAINTIAGGLRWTAGDRVLLNDLEFPANVWPFINLRRLGVEIDTVRTRDGKITCEDIEKAITPRTQLVALSAVQFLSGYRADLASIGRLCRSRNIVFAVDAIQAVGAVAIDVREMSIDALSAGGQKWQTAPHGTGFLYVTEELQDRIRQASLGWLAVENPWDFSNFLQPVASAARRYEGGSLNMPGLWGYHAALTMLHEFGMENIERRIRHLTGILLEGLAATPRITILTPLHESERAGIVTISLPEGIDPGMVFKHLLARKVNPAVRQGLIRFSPHFYMTADEMKQVVETFRECLAQR
jgi:selenocysteine lyase/cysteine desulfurase